MEYRLELILIPVTDVDRAKYLRRPGDTEFRSFKLDVLRVEEGRVAEITTFGAGLFAVFGLPRTMATGSRAPGPPSDRVARSVDGGHGRHTEHGR